jgi:hypothetical protein
LGCAAAQIAIALCGEFFRLMTLKSFVKIFEGILYPQLYPLHFPVTSVESTKQVIDANARPDVSERAGNGTKENGRRSLQKIAGTVTVRDGEPLSVLHVSRARACIRWKRQTPNHPSPVTWRGLFDHPSWGRFFMSLQLLDG